MNAVNRDAWRSLLDALPVCSSCDAPATREHDGVLFCHRHGGGNGSCEFPHSRLIRAITSSIEQQSENGEPSDADLEALLSADPVGRLP